ncbi:hypothetical protein [Actinokineospora globicatena]|uniref:hypothetical protein n=1 Tax=Actinokineospora globicatena TaxID=103729 RepID=UPI0020A2F614|nr:hypothetical protein [Actinokineospora globicatena]GLW77368.1 hypothetical protein Aglo01_18500 [Actinokineospora globicatena]GLW84202.1 hypothetical protein Aglo02_18420 [Actinokineospora globicatena]
MTGQGSANAAAAALTAHPELQRLFDMEGAGWHFVALRSEGSVVQIKAVLVWPDRWTDAILIHNHDDAGGLRLDPDGGIVAEHSGGMVEVIDFLLDLPAPGAPGAPSLVKARGPELWVSSRNRPRTVGTCVSLDLGPFKRCWPYSTCRHLKYCPSRSDSTPSTFTTSFAVECHYLATTNL